MVGLKDLQDLFQPNDSMIRSLKHSLSKDEGHLGPELLGKDKALYTYAKGPASSSPRKRRQFWTCPPRATTQLEWGKKKSAKSAVKIACICREPGAAARRPQCLDSSRALISSLAAADQHQQIILDVAGEKEPRDPGHRSGHALLGQAKPRQLPASQLGGEGNLAAVLVSATWERLSLATATSRKGQAKPKGTSSHALVSG